MSYVNTPQHGSRTTELLSPPAKSRARSVAAGLIALLVALAFVLDVRERRQAAQAEPQVRYILMIATPSPRPIEPTAAPVPTAEPVVIFATVEVPIYIEVAAPVVEAPPTYAPPTELPAVIGEVVDWQGNTTRIAP